LNYQKNVLIYNNLTNSIKFTKLIENKNKTPEKIAEPAEWNNLPFNFVVNILKIMFEHYPVKGNVQKNTIAQAQKMMFFLSYFLFIFFRFTVLKIFRTLVV